MGFPTVILLAVIALALAVVVSGLFSSKRSIVGALFSLAVAVVACGGALYAWESPIRSPGRSATERSSSCRWPPRRVGSSAGDRTDEGDGQPATACRVRTAGLSPAGRPVVMLDSSDRRQRE